CLALESALSFDLRADGRAWLALSRCLADGIADYYPRSDGETAGARPQWNAGDFSNRRGCVNPARNVWGRLFSSRNRSVYYYGVGGIFHPELFGVRPMARNNAARSAIVEDLNDRTRRPMDVRPAPA